MATTTKPQLKTAIAEAIYNEILTNSAAYYYFWGKTTPWSDENSPVTPDTSTNYEIDVRDNIIFLKKINAIDAVFGIPRHDWTANTVYDMYDSCIGRQVTFDVTSVDDNVLTGSFDDSQVGIGWVATGTGIPAGTAVTDITNTTITLSENVTGTPTSVTITKLSDTGADSLDSSLFYVMTSNFNVYKCLNNNGGAESTVQPSGMHIKPITTSDGYVWKYMFSVPQVFINKFLTEDRIPVIRATNGYSYSAGSIAAVQINNPGENYSYADRIEVEGDGYLEGNKYRILNVDVVSGGTGFNHYPTITISPPLDSVENWPGATGVGLGDLYKTSNNRIYEVVIPGNVSGSEPIHTGQTPVLNGSASLKFVGAQAGATAAISNGAITAINLTGGMLGQVLVTHPGRGYNDFNQTPLDVMITGNGTGAAAVANVSDGIVRSVTVTNSGSGYTQMQASVTAPASAITVKFPDPLINYNTDTINVAAHGLHTGNLVKYTCSTNWPIGGLTNDSEYFVIVVDDNSFKLATTYANAIAYPPTPINLYADEGNILDVRLRNTSTKFEITENIDYVDNGATGVHYQHYVNTTTGVFRCKVLDNLPIVANVTSVSARVWNVGRTSSVFIRGTVSSAFLDGDYVEMTIKREDGATGFDGYFTDSIGRGEIIFRSTRHQLSTVREVAKLTPVLYYGYGYNSIPTLTITRNVADTGATGASGIINVTRTTAEIAPTIENGQITGARVVDGGIGYSYATLKMTNRVTGAPSSGVDADLSVVMSQTNLKTPQYSIEQLAIPGSIDSISLLNGGSQYTTASVTISGNGTGATGIAVIDNTGAIEKITVTNAGQNYTTATVTVTGDGDGCKAYPNISPIGGHGSDAVKELNADCLIISAPLYKEKNQGFTVTNDYRQTGIIKNPLQFGAKKRLSNKAVSPCFVITGDFTWSSIQEDMELLINNKTFVVVAKLDEQVDDSQISLLVVNVDGTTPLVGDYVQYGNSETATLSSVKLPTVDKYSGDLLFVDNSEPFEVDYDSSTSAILNNKTTLKF